VHLQRQGETTVLEEHLRTREGDRFDVIVAGGGASGLLAAVSAARCGARTLLVEHSGCLGGTATYGLVAQWMGFFNGPQRVVGGLSYELVQRTIEAGGSEGFHRYVLAEASRCPLEIRSLPFNPEVVKVVADAFAQDAGVRLRLHSRVVAPLMAGGVVTGVIVEDIEGRTALRASVVIDASGDAIVAAGAGVSCRGEEAELKMRRQPCTLVFRMSNVDVDRFRALPREQKRALALEGLAQERIFWESLSFCSTPGRTDAVCLMSRIVGIDGLKADDLTRAEVEGRRQVASIASFLKERVPGFERSVLATIAGHVGVRETRRIVGRHTLTEEDIVHSVRFDDAIALGAGPMDLHDANGTGIALRMPPTPFEIPLRCMLPARVDGLLVCGRAISATREANGGSRHMGTAMALGEAAGVAAAQSALTRVPLAELSLPLLRKTLRKQGALVSVGDAVESEPVQVVPVA